MLCVWVFALMYVCVPHVYLVITESEKSTRSPGNGITHDWESLWGTGDRIQVLCQNQHAFSPWVILPMMTWSFLKPEQLSLFSDYSFFFVWWTFPPWPLFYVWRMQLYYSWCHKCIGKIDLTRTCMQSVLSTSYSLDFHQELPGEGLLSSDCCTEEWAVFLLPKRSTGPLGTTLL